jgi:glycine cleavage system H protein
MVAIFVIFTIVAFILVDALVQKSELKRQESAFREKSPRRSSWNFPATLKSLPGGVYTDCGHTWVSLNLDGSAKVGIDTFAHYAVGRIDKLVLPRVGQKFRRGEDLFTLRQGERKATFKAPIDGVIETVNEALSKDLDRVQGDAYREDWLCSLRPQNLARNLRQMLIAEEALAWLRTEVKRLQEFILERPVENTALGIVLQDGGEITSGVLELMDNETWNEFASEFLQNDKSKMRPA